MIMKSGIKKRVQEVVVSKNEKGFTTIELIIVIVIAGIMAAIAIPRMDNINTVDLYTTARQVKSDIRYTQELAMAKYMQTTITFNAGADTYTITGTGINDQRSLPGNSSATFDAGYTFTFFSSGLPTAGAAGWTVGITSKGDQ